MIQTSKIEHFSSFVDKNPNFAPDARTTWENFAPSQAAFTAR
jgi:hypothetical protein